MEIEFIEKFVKDEFPLLPIDDRRDLINTAWLFLAENNIVQISGSDTEVLKNLKKYLSSELNQVNWREIKIEDWRQRLSDNSRNSNTSEDEKLSFIKEKSKQVDGIEIKQELENAAAAFETRKEELKSLLPPVLFEALNRGIFADTQVKWTAGFEEQTLKILCWRALMRIKWFSQ